MLDEQFTAEVYFLFDIFGHFGHFDSLSAEVGKIYHWFGWDALCLQVKANGFHNRPNSNKIATLQHSTRGTHNACHDRLHDKIDLELYWGFSIPTEVLQFACDPFSNLRQTSVQKQKR